MSFNTDDENNSLVITARPEDGSAHDAEATWFADPTADLSDGAFVAGATIDNSTDLYTSAACVADFDTDATFSGVGAVRIWMEVSTDGGSSWPSSSTDFDPVTDAILLKQIKTDTGVTDRDVPFIIR